MKGKICAYFGRLLLATGYGLVAIAYMRRDGISAKIASVKTAYKIKQSCENRIDNYWKALI